MLFRRYESLDEPIASRGRFLKRFSVNAALALALIGSSLAIGMTGYSVLEGMGWVDAFVNAAMIISGMGPLDPLKHDAGRIFAGIFALYSGMLLIATSALLIAPLLHRLLHRLHANDDDDRDER